MDNSFNYLYFIIGFTIISLIAYIIFLYIPAVQAENSFNESLTQVNLALNQARETEDLIDDTNQLVNSGFNTFCEFYNNDPNATTFFGTSFDEICADVT